MIFCESITKLGRLDKIILEINRIIENDIEPYQSFPKIYILGPTGSGKSSLLCCLANKNVEVVLAKGKKPLLKGEGIGFGGKSCTKMPNISVDLNNELIFCDCPGFKDTKGLEQEIINSFVIDHLFSNESGNNQIKILLVVSIHDLNASRQQNFLDTLEQLNEMFPHINKIKAAIGLVITQEDEKYSGIDILESIDDKACFEVKCWIDYFMRNDDQVFTFPKAKDSDVNKKYDFEDHDKLIYFLLNNYISVPEHKISLSSQAFDKIEVMIENQINNTKKIISEFFEKISEEYNDLTDPKSIKSWIDQMENLYKSNIKNSTDFKNSIQKHLKQYESYEDYYLMLNDSEVINSFFDKIKNQNTLGSVLENCFKKNFEKEINQLKKSYSHAQENQNQKIENQKCHQKIDQLEKNADANKKMQIDLQNKVNTLERRIEENQKYQEKQKEIIDDLKEKNRKNEIQAILNEKDKKIQEINEKNKDLQKEKDSFIQYKIKLRNDAIEQIKKDPFQNAVYCDLYGKDSNKWPIRNKFLKLDSNIPVSEKKRLDCACKYLFLIPYNH